MGFHVRGACLRQTAPVYFFNDSGSPSWGGKAVAQMTCMEVLAMLKFCQREGFREGWNDHLAGRATSDAGNMFHSQFADGVPFNVWRMSYASGARVARRRDGQEAPIALPAHG